MEKIRIAADYLDSKRTVTSKKERLDKRAEVIKKFVDRLNASRVDAGYKPCLPSYWAYRMSHIKDLEQLERFYGDCNEARNFSSYWWWALKAK